MHFGNTIHSSVNWVVHIETKCLHLHKFYFTFSRHLCIKKVCSCQCLQAMYHNYILRIIMFSCRAFGCITLKWMSYNGRGVVISLEGVNLGTILFCSLFIMILEYHRGRRAAGVLVWDWMWIVDILALYMRLRNGFLRWVFQHRVIYTDINIEPHNSLNSCLMTGSIISPGASSFTLTMTLGTWRSQTPRPLIETRHFPLQK